MSDWEHNMMMAATEIAYMVLSGQFGEDVCEQALEELGINDDEASCLEQNLESWLEELE